ncbi:AraC family transcriptional regulator [Chryseobacterium sp. FH2]|uniref:helix-turn-helix domain-containing protein n=1 Tax=Chryseobacterium sp. FH2 TaxID=1674291 RepID=UPI00065AE912|nr:helix-turn-helix domain-containing protein [Chryseobacterium sp. FH2]KMQ68781.1 AraC family transcriptional regulator [Chryseobacterium sp. FH2]
MADKQQNKYAEIVLSCIEEKYFKDEIILEYHSFIRIISGEMKVIQADSSFTFGAGDTLLIPRNELSTYIKYPKDGRPYKSVVMTLTTERLKRFYTKNPIQLSEPHTHKIRTFDKHPLLESFFASIIPYFDLSDELPEKIISVKIEEALTILRTTDKGIDNLLADFSEPGKIDLAEFMEKNYMFNMPMEKFGYLTGRSLTTFKRDFKKAFYTTPRKWLTQKRLELAHYQLTEKGRKPVEIFYEVGFENLSHFSFVFKKHFGYPPTELTNRKAKSGS